MEEMQEAINPYDSFMTDPDIEGNIGINLEYSSLDGKQKYRINVIHAGDGNKAYTSFINRKRAPFEKTRRKMTDEEWLVVIREAFALHVVKNWECLVDGAWVQGIFDEKGQVQPFAKETVIKTFTNARRLFADVITQAADYGQFRKEAQEDVIKN
jgi:hypothetical protein